MQDPLKQGLKRALDLGTSAEIAYLNARSTKTRIETDKMGFTAETFKPYLNARSTKTRIETVFEPHEDGYIHLI